MGDEYVIQSSLSYELISQSQQLGGLTHCLLYHTCFVTYSKQALPGGVTHRLLVG